MLYVTFSGPAGQIATASLSPDICFDDEHQVITFRSVSGGAADRHADKPLAAVLPEVGDEIIKHTETAPVVMLVEHRGFTLLRACRPRDFPPKGETGEDARSQPTGAIRLLFFRQPSGVVTRRLIGATGR